ncbi:hypothetical protein HaLaN_22442 [Haematococcus lacustris]|uniref:Uncharacterized protein n=1 Tax=Haematococcus lacustris TaxID=44745 RepID=A0A699ZRT5_HAELA|nr:hypothetical protein HaLaN_22442 [Haematococcus lacustris]
MLVRFRVESELPASSSQAPPPSVAEALQGQHSKGGGTELLRELVATLSGGARSLQSHGSQQAEAEATLKMGTHSIRLKPSNSLPKTDPANAPTTSPGLRHINRVRPLPPAHTFLLAAFGAGSQAPGHAPQAPPSAPTTGAGRDGTRRNVRDMLLKMPAPATPSHGLQDMKALTCGRRPAALTALFTTGRKLPSLSPVSISSAPGPTFPSPSALIGRTGFTPMQYAARLLEAVNTPTLNPDTARRPTKALQQESAAEGELTQQAKQDSHPGAVAEAAEEGRAEQHPSPPVVGSCLAQPSPAGPASRLGLGHPQLGHQLPNPQVLVLRMAEELVGMVQEANAAMRGVHSMGLQLLRMMSGIRSGSGRPAVQPGTTVARSEAVLPGPGSELGSSSPLQGPWVKGVKALRKLKLGAPALLLLLRMHGCMGAACRVHGSVHVGVSCTYP